MTVVHSLALKLYAVASAFTYLQNDLTNFIYGQIASNNFVSGGLTDTVVQSPAVLFYMVNLIPKSLSP